MIEHEKIILDIFKKHCQSFPPGKVHKSESPDFIIQDGPKKKTGIELVQLLPAADHHYSQAGILKPKFSFEQINMTLLLKEKKRLSYQHPTIQSLWLLIHFDYLDSSGSFNLKNHIDKWHFTFGFDQVWMIDLFENTLYVLNKT